MAVENRGEAETWLRRMQCVDGENILQNSVVERWVCIVEKAEFERPRNSQSHGVDMADLELVLPDMIAEGEPSFGGCRYLGRGFEVGIAAAAAAVVVAVAAVVFGGIGVEQLVVEEVGRSIVLFG